MEGYIKKETARKESKQDETKLCSRAEAAGRKSVAGPHHRLNILSLPERYALSHLLFTSLPCRCFSSRLPPFIPRSFSPAGEPGILSRILSPYLRRISFFSLLSSFRARSPSRASPYPPFLLAQLTKMGPAASGSRFPRKLSSYKINYPPYFIAPHRSGPGCAST